MQHLRFLQYSEDAELLEYETVTAQVLRDILKKITQREVPNGQLFLSDSLMLNLNVLLYVGMSGTS